MTSSDKQAQWQAMYDRCTTITDGLGKPIDKRYFDE
jgi:hypothetical protein